VVVALAIALLAWALQSATGSAWLVGWLPQVSIVAPKGSLLGDFSAERLDIILPGALSLRLDSPRWHALGASRGDHGRWLHLKIDTLHADRVTLRRDVTKAPASEGSAPPQTLRLPIEIEIRDASIDELHFGPDDAAPVRELNARLHFGDEGGLRHRFDDLAAAYERGRATGAGTIGADPPFAIDARAVLASLDAAPAWQAEAAAHGPLAALDITATARVSPAASRGPQSLAAHAVVRPFAAWPLGELQASTDSLDLSAFSTAAPATSLSGKALATSTGLDQPAAISVELRNGRAGRWNEGLLPVRQISADLRARPDTPRVLLVRALTAELGSAALPAGRLVGRGRWAPEGWSLDTELMQVRPSALDARAADTTLDGTVSAIGTGFASASASASASAASAVPSPADTPAVDLVAELTGRLADRRLPRDAPRAARLRIEAHATERDIELRTAEASAGAAKATLSGRLTRTAAGAPWHAAGGVQLADFDPAPWWPGSAGGVLGRGANRLNATGEFDLSLPNTTSTHSTLEAIAGTRGTARVSIAHSVLAGVPLEGVASFANSDGRARPAFDIVAAGNRLSAKGVLAAPGQANDEWKVGIDAPQLARLSPLAFAPEAHAASPGASAGLAGTLTANATVNGRWPDLSSQGELHAAALRYGAIVVGHGEGKWRLGSAGNAALDATLALDAVSWSGRVIEHAGARLSGTAAAHHVELRVESQALPPEWVDTVTLRPVASEAAPATNMASAAASTASNMALSPAAAAVAASAPTRAATSAPASRSALLLTADGGLVSSNGERAAGWAGTVHELLAQSLAPPSRTWLRARELRGSIAWAGGPLRANLEPGALQALGATLRWSRAAWQAADAHGAGARIDAQAVIEPVAVAPILRSLQPEFGWGGDLAVGAHLDVRSAPTVAVAVVLERARGDLTVTDEIGTQSLGMTDLRFGIAASEGTWNFTAGLAGNTLGVASAAIVARTNASAAWPAAEAPLSGVLELRVANLGTWGTWVPAGWRLGGALHANASIGGRFGAPEYTGHIEGSNLGVRNFVQGVNVTEGDVAIALQGSTARIEKFTARGGSGSIRLEGDAHFDTAPVARLQLTADRFQMLGRVDRRIVASGSAAMRLDATALGLDGAFKIDEGLIDFTRSDAPSLGDDVEVIRRPAAASAGASAAERTSGDTTLLARPGSTPSNAPAATPGPAPLAPRPPASRQVALDLRVATGERLRVRGRGLDAGLRGELHITSPAGKLTVNGTLNAVDGTYQAYAQKLTIDRGVLGFVGPVENPRLDIEATRPNLDVRVGVKVAGTALNPRIRLFSEPDMSDVDKLSWLVLGRASDSAGSDNTALLQRAALALLSGEGPGVTDRLIHAIGLDEISVRQGTGEVKETIVSLGKQISKRWYVGYERGLNATTGSWQLIYRIAQRLSVKAQAGGDNAVDLNWTLRWK